MPSSHQALEGAEKKVSEYAKWMEGCGMPVCPSGGHSTSMLEPEPVQGEEAGTQRSRQSRCGTGRMQASKIVGLWLTARCAVVPCASSALLCHGKS